MKKYIILFLLFLAGCSDVRQQFEQGKLKSLVGQSEGAVTELLGRPQEVLETKEGKKLIYITYYKTYTPQPAGAYLSGSQNLQGTFERYACQTTFFVQKGVISAVERSGNCL